MNLLRPRSLSALVLLGLAIIALPLLGALVLTGVQMRQLSETSERIIADGVGATRLTRDLFALSSSLERQVRLYPVLGDRRVIDAYAALDARLADIESQLSRELRLAQAQASLTQFSQLRRGISAQMMAASTTLPDYPSMQADFARMEQVAGTLSSQISAYIDTEVSGLRERARRAQQLTFWGFILLIPLTTGAILLFSLRVGRPLGQIDRAISELGSGALHDPIAVRGPADLERLGRQLEWLRMRLLELAQERNRFLRHMSHELKTPLANIREGTELLMDGAVGELQTAQREVTGILKENGLRLQRMIENLLSYSAWQSSSLGLEISEFRLRPLVKQIIENQQLALLSQRVRLDVNVDDLVVTADRGKVRLILENLLSNAIKYTPRAGTIHLRARSQDGILQLEVGTAARASPRKNASTSSRPSTRARRLRDT